MTYLVFSANALRRIADGRKRATIAPRSVADKLRAGEVVNFRAEGCTATVPVRVAAVKSLQDLAHAPAAADAAGLELKEFTKMRSWRTYLACMSAGWQKSGVTMLVFDAAGELSGEFRCTRSLRKSPDSFHGRPWRRVSTTDTQITPGTEIHPADQTELHNRLRAESIVADSDTKGVPPQTSAVIDALAATGKCTALPSRAQRKRLNLPDDVIDTALAWLVERGLVVGAGKDTVLAPRILHGLRVLH